MLAARWVFRGQRRKRLNLKKRRSVGAEGGIRPQDGVCCDTVRRIRLRPTKLRNRILTPNKAANGKGIESDRGYQIVMRLIGQIGVGSLET